MDILVQVTAAQEGLHGFSRVLVLPKTKLRCTLTGKVVDECCYEKRDWNTYCPLAGKTVDSCCCEPVAGVTEEK